MLAYAMIIGQTKKWINDVVIGCNFCPFAAREVKQDKVRYRVLQEKTENAITEILLEEAKLLDKEAGIETTLLILSGCFEDFDEYLDMVTVAEKILQRNQYEGIYQLASFHPDYCFAGADETDAANYTNRSPYPMLHLLREESIEKALERFPDPESIPERNINWAREKGLAYMQALRAACMQ
jgi:hypothetical protein